MCTYCTSVSGVWGDPPTAQTGGDSCHYVTDVYTSVVLYCFHLKGELSGGDSCHQFTDMHTHSTSPYCCHHLERFGHTYECYTIPTM